MKHFAFTLYIILFLSSLGLHAQQIKIGNYTFPGGVVTLVAMFEEEGGGDSDSSI